MNDYLFEWPSFQYVWMCIYPYAHMSIQVCPYVHMCEKNLKDICPSVHAYMQIGAYITLFAYVCAYMYICVEVFMSIHVIFGLCLYVNA